MSAERERIETRRPSIDYGNRYECRACGALSNDCYRCSECGHDLAGEESSAGRIGGDR